MLDSTTVNKDGSHKIHLIYAGADIMKESGVVYGARQHFLRRFYVCLCCRTGFDSPRSNSLCGTFFFLSFLPFDVYFYDPSKSCKGFLSHDPFESGFLLDGMRTADSTIQ
jgi:hypothetical protein